jgi:hypothetical protein
MAGASSRTTNVPGATGELIREAVLSGIKAEGRASVRDISDEVPRDDTESCQRTLPTSSWSTHSSSSSSVCQAGRDITWRGR